VDVDESRAALLDWLRERRPDEPIETVETHISVLAFQGDRAYKLKKAVAFPFLDLSTRERRLEDCEREVALNRRFAPDIYLGVRALSGRDGEVIDHVVEMVRLPSEHRLGALALAHHDVGPCIEQLARDMARFHGSVPTCARSTRPRSAMRSPHCGRLGIAQTSPYGDHLPRQRHVASRRWLAVLRGRGSRFDAHRLPRLRTVTAILPKTSSVSMTGRAHRLPRVRRSAPLLAMSLPTWHFSEWISSASDADLSRRFLDRYREASADVWPASLEDLYIAYRAHVRAKVACLRHSQGDERAAEEASALLHLAHSHLEAGRVRVVLVGGPPASGKSTLAMAIGHELDWPVLRSDVVRKEIAGWRNAACGTRRSITRPNPGGELCDARDQAACIRLWRSVVIDASWC
jgi:aminoglycoside phosphotransferase family enzyme